MHSYNARNFKKSTFDMPDMLDDCSAERTSGCESLVTPSDVPWQVEDPVTFRNSFGNVKLINNSPFVKVSTQI